MLCEKCHQKEALVHITEMDGRTRDEGTPTVQWHFCEPCGEEYQCEMQRFFEHSPLHHHQGMSKEERGRATEELRDHMKRHMAAWVAGREPE